MEEQDSDLNNVDLEMASKFTKKQEAPKEVEKEEEEKKPNTLLTLAKQPIDEKKEEVVEYSEEVQKKIDNYKKQINDIKSNFHKSNIQNKLSKSRIEKLYEQGDIDDNIKSALISDDPLPMTEEDQSLYEWNNFTDRVSKDLARRYEYTKDPNIKKHSDAFAHYLDSQPRKRALELAEIVQKLEKDESLEVAVTQLLELGESHYNDDMQDYFDNNKDVKKLVNSYKTKVNDAKKEIDKLTKDNNLLRTELKKYTEDSIAPVKDYKSSASPANSNGKGKYLSSLEKIKANLRKIDKY